MALFTPSEINNMIKTDGLQRSGLFQAHSVVDSMDEPKYKSIPRVKARSYLSEIERRIRLCLEARAEADKIFSNGYFENHYPTADKLLKKLFHEKCMYAISHMMSDEPEEEAPEEVEEQESSNSKVTIIIR